MRSARSLRLGEVLPAERISYDDCADDDIVCDLCGNRVFKCVRGEGQDAIHYLSHYHAQSEEARLCEERHASLGGTGTLSGTVSRGQGLSARLDAIGRVLAIGDPGLGELANHAMAACETADGSTLFPMPTAASILRNASCNAFRLLASYKGRGGDLPVAIADVPALLRSIRNAADTLPADDKHGDWARWTQELTSLLVLAESAPALNMVWAHAVAMLAHRQEDALHDVATTLLSIIVPTQADTPDCDPERLRSLVTIQMIRVVEGLDPAMPVPRTA